MMIKIYSIYIYIYIYIYMSRPHFPSMWEMLQHFTRAQCEMSDKDFTPAQCKMSDKDGCSRLPEAAQGCPRLP